MKARHLIMLAAIACLAAVITVVGCKKKEEPAAPPPAPKMEEMTKHAEETKETATKTAEEAKKTAETMAASMEQTMCPVMDGNKIDKNVFVEYKGKKVYFCCADCKAKFDADPEKYVANLPQFKQ
jgi:YHS domain-containing protein